MEEMLNRLAAAEFKCLHARTKANVIINMIENDEIEHKYELLLDTMKEIAKDLSDE